MELLRIKKKLRLAEKGHKLLKQKRDALVIEFFKMLNGVKETRAELAEKMADAQKALYTAQAMQGQQDVLRFALGISSNDELNVGSRTIMGVKIHEIKNVKVSNEWYGYFESAVELDSAVVKFRELVPTLMRVSEKQLALKRLGDEISKSKRKVNSLEYLIMPNLRRAKKSISFKLEEQARDNFTRLKKIKARRAG
jgi:V/A-type H+/Na+-transporting ATPase subunit D